MSKRRRAAPPNSDDEEQSHKKNESLHDMADEHKATPRSKRRKIIEKGSDLASASEAALTSETPIKHKSRSQKATKSEEKVNRNGSAATTSRDIRSGKQSAEAKREVDVDGDGNEAGHTSVKRKRKTKEEKEVEAMPLAPRTLPPKLYVGAHVSSAGGVQNSIPNSVHIGANAFALFLKSQRKWANPPLAEDACAGFRDGCKNHAYDQTKHVVPHGSYLVNLAHTDKARTEQAYDSFVDDLKRCERLGIKLYNFHPGVANSVGGDRHAAIAHLASNINRAHSETSSVITLLENMAAGGSVLGSTFEDLRDIIALIQQKERVGVCLDTCHAFAGGYDLRSPVAFKATMDNFDEVVGFKYLRAVHLNDSKAPFASHRDLHANIGTGFVGLRGFHNLVNDPRFEGLPLILETPIDATDANGAPLEDDKGKQKEDKGIWAQEIKLLESLVGMDVESDEFLRLEKTLARKGEPERQRLQEQIQRKRDKQDKSKTAAKGKRSMKANANVKDEKKDEDSLSE